MKLLKEGICDSLCVYFFSPNARERNANAHAYRDLFCRSLPFCCLLSVSI